MEKYQRIPELFDAFQWTGGPDQTEDPEWIIEEIKAGRVCFPDVGIMEIKSPEGSAWAEPGDYVVRNSRGEISPCNPQSFATAYQLAP